jgi:hypothetical protein
MRIAKVRSAARWISILLILALFAACVPLAPIAQGEVVAQDEAKKTITVQDEANATAEPIVLDASDAEIGNWPEVGDKVRVVYEERDGKNHALRVMNMTRQAEAGGH